MNPTAAKTKPEVNEPLIRKVYQHIKEDPKSWNQNTYGVDTVELGDSQYQWEIFQAQHCDTTACFAGWTLVLSEHPFIRETDEDGDLLSVWERSDAQKVLGFDNETAEQIFYWYPDNNIPVETRLMQLRSRIRELTGIDLDPEADLAYAPTNN